MNDDAQSPLQVLAELSDASRAQALALRAALEDFGRERSRLLGYVSTFEAQTARLAALIQRLEKTATRLTVMVLALGAALVVALAH